MTAFFAAHARTFSHACSGVYLGFALPDRLYNTGNEGVFIASGGNGGNLLQSNFTVEAFFSIANFGGNNDRAIFRVRNSGSFPFYLNTKQVDVGSANDLVFGLGNKEITYAANLTLNQTYHIAATYNGTTMSLYLDGVLLGTNTQSFSGTNINAAIGNDPQYPNGYNVALLGTIDEVRISNSALLPSQFLNAVPEPSAVALLGATAIAGLFLKRRTRQSHGRLPRSA